MATLTITFKDMFLYVQRTSDPDVVLLPSGRGHHDHAGEVTGLGVDEELSRTVVSFAYRINGTFVPIAGSGRKSPPKETNLLDLRDVVKASLGMKTVSVRADLLKDFPEALNARVVLPAAATTAFPARRAKARSVKWDFKDGTQVKRSQELTDIMQTSVTVDGAPWVLLTSPRGTIEKPLVPAGDGNYYVTIRNRDTKCRSEHVPDGDYVLHHYVLLYALTDGDAKGSPVPEGRLGSDDKLHKTSECLPICGGAKCG